MPNSVITCIICGGKFDKVDIDGWCAECVSAIECKPVSENASQSLSILRTGSDWTLNDSVTGIDWFIGRTPEACATYAFAQDVNIDSVVVRDGAGWVRRTIHRNPAVA